MILMFNIHVHVGHPLRRKVAIAAGCLKRSHIYRIQIK
jgi:hypothetical protein